ncbi:MAG: hypothetical protein ABJO36_04935 [Litorimonas sp.]
MKISRFLLSAVFSASLLCPSLSSADPIEVRSKNVIFVGDVSEEEGKQLVSNLEIYRNTIIALVGLKGRPDKKPLRVYGIKNEGKLTKFTDISGIAGVYKNGLKGPVFVTTTKGGFDSGKWASQVALHEYGHHVLHGMSQDHYPRWYDEGFANYLSTFKIEGDIVTIGAPNVLHGRSLKENRWMNPETVFRSIRNYPRTRNISQFYGQSWLYVHYMQNHPELGNKLPDYLANLKSGQEPLQAFEAAYGMTAREFHNLARGYWSEDAFPVLQFKASEALLNPKMTIRPLTEDEAILAFAEGERNFMSKKKAKSLKKKYDKLADSMAEALEVLIGQAHNTMYLEEYDTAKLLVGKALEKAPKNSDVLTLQGDIYYHELSDALFDSQKKKTIKKFPSDDKTKAVAAYFEEALSVDPNDYTAVTHLVNLYGRSNLPLTPIGETAVKTMSQSYLNPRHVGEHMDLANIYERMGEMPKACAYFGIAKARVESYEDKDVNDDFARVQAFDTAHPQCL